VEGTFTHYLRIFNSPRFLWVNSIRGGYAQNLSKDDSSGIPSKHAFFLGGQSTIRGYSGTEDDRIPSKTDLPSQSPNDLIIGDFSSYNLLKSELRFPIYGDFGGVLFYDAGEVRVAGLKFDQPFHHSYGIGVRYYTPIGPISLDYGRKINPDESLENNDTYHVHFSIGNF
jgi:outer membrane protein assembly factor BamA